MKLSKYILLLFLPLFFAACEDEDVLPVLEDVEAPEELSIKVVMDAENPGLATVIPGGRGVTLFTVDYGDGSDTEDLRIGDAGVHQYVEGNYNVGLTATGINGMTATLSEQITVAAVPPSNLSVNISPTAGNPLSINVSAAADNASGFVVYFGETVDEVATPLPSGVTISYTYTTPGNYAVRVVALSQGMETSLEYTETVTITDGSTAVVFPLDFENTSTTYTWEGFGGVSASIIDNPDASGENTSARVARLSKSSGSEVWAGAFINLDAPVDFSSSDKAFLNVWSPRAGIPVILKIETANDADVFVEATTSTSTANAWELVEFDFSAAGDLTIDYRKVVIFFDFGTAGMGEDFFFDDLSLDGTTGGDGGGGNDGAVDLPLDFQDAEANYAFTGFGGAEAVVVDNPDASGINTSSRVAALTKNAGEVWAGVFIDLDDDIDFSGGQAVRLKVWSPTPDAPVTLKIENPDNADDNVEMTLNTTTTNAWEELEFDLSGIEAFTGMRRIVLFANFGTNGTGEVYYFDDLSLDGMVGGGDGGGGGAIELPLEFEDPDVTYVFTGFGGASGEVIDNPDAGGINTSGRVAALTKNAGEVWAGVFIDLDNDIDFSGGQAVRLKVWSPTPDAPITLKIENPDNADDNVEMTLNTTTTNDWEELEFDLSGIEAFTGLRRIVLFANFGTNGSGEIYYFDDIRQN